MDLLESHQRAQQVFATLLARLQPGQLDAATCCPGWAVRDLISHVVAGNARMAGIPAPDFDDLPAAVTAHAETARAAQAAFAAPDGLSRTIELPFGQLPASQVIGMRTTDALAHTWDLARAIGQPTDFEPDLCAAMLQAARQRLKPEFRGPGRPFAEEQPCAAERPAADQLAAFLGRSVE